MTPISYLFKTKKIKKILYTITFLLISIFLFSTNSFAKTIRNTQDFKPKEYNQDIYSYNEYENDKLLYNIDNAPYIQEEEIPCLDFKYDLRYNPEGEGPLGDIYKLQLFLYKSGYTNYPPSGSFGALTKTGLVSYQYERGLNPSGTLDLVTRIALSIDTCHNGSLLLNTLLGGNSVQNLNKKVSNSKNATGYNRKIISRNVFEDSTENEKVVDNNPFRIGLAGSGNVYIPSFGGGGNVINNYYGSDGSGGSGSGSGGTCAVNSVSASSVATSSVVLNWNNNNSINCSNAVYRVYAYINWLNKWEGNPFGKDGTSILENAGYATTSDKTLTINKLRNGLPYTFYVSIDGKSASSSVATSTLPDDNGLLLSQLTGSSTGVGILGLTFKWNYPDNGNDFFLYISKDNNSWTNPIYIASTSRIWATTTLTQNTPYYFAMAIIDKRWTFGYGNPGLSSIKYLHATTTLSDPSNPSPNNTHIPFSIAISSSTIIAASGTPITNIIATSTNATATSWRISPALPSLLAYTPITGSLNSTFKISGTPTVYTEEITYTIYATSSTGYGTSTTFTLKVNDASGGAGGGGGTPPPAPTGLSFTNVSTSSLTFNWASSTGATGYEIYWATGTVLDPSVSGVGNKVLVSGLNTILKDILGLATSTKYTFGIKAGNGTATSSLSATTSATTLGNGFYYSLNSINFGDIAPTLSANIPSGAGSPTYATSSDTIGCSVNNNTGQLTIIKVGKCVINQNYAGADAFNSSKFELTINKGNPNITNNSSLPSYAVGFNYNANGTYTTGNGIYPNIITNSDGLWNISTTSTPTICSANNTTQILQIASGTCKFKVFVASTSNFNAATSSEFSIQISSAIVVPSSPTADTSYPQTSYNQNLNTFAKSAGVQINGNPGNTIYSVSLHWLAPTDNSRVLGYNLYDTGDKINSSLITSLYWNFSNNIHTSNGEHQLCVKSLNEAGESNCLSFSYTIN